MGTDKHDLLMSLPYEAWVKCIKLYARQYPEGALPLFAVSSKWQKSLLEAPEIWTTIYLDGGHDEKCRAECFFQLSKNLPIELVLYDNSYALEAITKYLDRIEALRLCSYNIDNYVVGVLPHNLGIHRFPNLAHVYVELSQHLIFLVPRNIIDACPNLVGIHGAYVEEKNVPLLPAAVKDISIVGEGILPRGIGDRLEVLRIRCTPLENREASHWECFATPTSSLTTFELHYGANKVLAHSEDVFVDNTWYLLPLQAFVSTMHKNLQTLSITMPWYDISRLIPVLSTCGALRKLELILDYFPPLPQSLDIQPLTIEDIGHVLSLSLLIMPKWSTPDFRLKLVFSNVIKIFTSGQALNHLEDLQIELLDGGIEDSGLLELLGTTRNLKVLHLKGFPYVAPDWNCPKIQLSHLHTLVAGNEGLLQYIDVPRLVCLILSSTLSFLRREYRIDDFLAENLEYLAIPDILFYGWNDAISGASARPAFPRITRLTLSSPFSGYDSSAALDLSCLRHITLEDNRSNFSRDIKYSPLNQFMLEVLLSPKSCPRLQTISTNRYPNWALATFLFHRRKSCSDVSPILSLWLPGYPQILILNFLCRALDANVGYSDGGIFAAGRADKTICRRWGREHFRRRACRLCIKSGYIACLQSDGSSRMEEPSADPTVIDLLDLDTIVLDENPLEFTRDSWQAYLGNTATSSPLSEIPICQRHDHKILVHIGSHTLSGTTYDIH